MLGFKNHCVLSSSLCFQSAYMLAVPHSKPTEIEGLVRVLASAPNKSLIHVQHIAFMLDPEVSPNLKSFCRPFGAMIRPFVDAMHVQGGHSLFPAPGNSPAGPGGNGSSQRQ